MSFLSKRSQSQRSFIRGSEEMSVRRVEPDTAIQCRNDTLPAGSSMPPNLNATDFALFDSCVRRKSSKHSSSHLRFLAWVAYTRKFTDEPITQEERRTCPLLWCRAVFEDQEAMLQHVWDCEHLSKGLYWCFHCQKPERVGSFQCKRCQGTPSKTDRIATVAKRIFSKLGSKHHRTPKTSEPEPEPDMTIAKYPEISKTLENHPDFPTIYDAGPAGDYSSQELSRTTGMLGSGAEWTTRVSQELPDTQICEMIGSECPMELSAGVEDSWLPQNYQASQDNWFTPDLSSGSKGMNPTPKSRGSLDLLPPLNTQLPRPNQGRVYSDYHNDWTDEPMSATIVSPLSADGRCDDRFASIFQEISPTDTDMSGNSFLTDSGYTSATVASTWSSSSMANFELHPGFNEPRGKKRYRDEIENQAHSIDAVVSRNNSTKSTKSVSRQQPEAIEAVSSTHSPSRCPSTKKPKMQSPHWSSSETLIQSFSEVLDAHIRHTKRILREMPATPITTELLAMSRTSMVSIGLEALAGIIEGRNPTAIVQAFAFTHIAYAFSIAIDHDEIKVHTQEWFQDSLSWVSDLGSERQRTSYSQIAKALWQPVDSLKEGIFPRLFSAGNENRLFMACKRFLDVLESFGSSDKVPTDSEKIAACQTAFAKSAQKQVIDELIKTVSIEAFIEDVVKVEKRLNRGYIQNVRELELELMCAGKLASQSELAYTRFLSHLTHLCNSLYGLLPIRERAVYHIHDISLIKKLLPEELYNEQNDEEEREFELELEDDLPLGFEVGMLGTCEGQLRSAKECVQHGDEGFEDNFSSLNENPRSPLVTVPVRRPKSDQKRSSNHEPSRSTSSTQPSTNRRRPKPKNPTSQPQIEKESAYLSPESNSSPNQLTPSTPSLPNYQCSLCDYIPAGEEKWKASNLRRHRRTQHAAADTKGAHVCQWPGCTKSFTRSDNLRSHMRDKGHGLSVKGGDEPDDEEEEEDDSDNAPLIRGSKGKDGASDERGSKRRRLMGS